MYLFARHEEINGWLEQNPLALGAMFVAIGLVILGFGIAALLTGRAATKWGVRLEGPWAYAHGGIMSIAGGFCLIFGLSRLLGAMSDAQGPSAPPSVPAARTRQSVNGRISPPPPPAPAAASS